MTPLERAARAYHDSTRQFRYIRDCANPGRAPIAKPMPFVEWDNLDDDAKAERVNQVRAVLTAIREPSEGMIKAGECDGDMPFAEESWELMIDAALAEGA